MKYIEIDSYGKKIQFTTRSVFIDGKEYPYSQMSSVRYSLEKKVYAFKCGDEVQYIRYEDKDEKALSAIFTQIRKMHQKRDAAAAAKAVAPAGAHAFSVADVMSGKEVSSSDVTSRFTTRISVQDLLDAHEKELAAAQAPVPAEKLAEEVAAEEAAAEPAPVAAEEAAAEPAPVAAEEAAVEETAAAAEEVPVKAGEASEEAAETTDVAAGAAVETAEEKAEEKAKDAKESAADAKAAAAAAKAEAKAQAQAEKEKQRAEKEKAKQEKAAAKAKEREEKAKAKAEKAAAAGEAGKQSKFKKAIIIFIVILMFFVALGCAWYAAVGLSSSPASGPASTESQSYDDIDQMIQDLEE